MLIDWTGEFDAWFDRLSDRATKSDARALTQLARVDAAFTVLSKLTGEPTVETPTLRRVRQSRRNSVWRIGHPFTPDVAVRLIVWFPPERPGEVVVVLFGADKAQMTCSTTVSGPGPIPRSRATACTSEERSMTENAQPAKTADTTDAGRDTPSFVGTDKAAAKIAALRGIPGLVEASGQVYAEMVEDDRLYAESLAEIRKAANLTQVELGEHMGVPQSVISRLEKQSDMLLSTLADYLTAAGERPRVVVTVNGRDVEYDLTARAH